MKTKTPWQRSPGDLRSKDEKIEANVQEWGMREGSCREPSE